VLLLLLLLLLLWWTVCLLPPHTHGCDHSNLEVAQQQVFVPAATLYSLCRDDS
jgi:hypothetical protein